MTTTPEDSHLPAGRNLAACVVAGVLMLATLGLLSRAHVVAHQVPAVLPAWMVLVLFCDVLTAALLVEQYRAGRGPRMLALSWAYVWSAALVVPTVLNNPGVLTDHGLFGGDANVTAWLWAARHVGLPVFIGLALVPWPARVECWLALDRPVFRTARVVGSHVALLLVAAAIIIVVAHSPDVLPVIVTDQGRMFPGFSHGVLALNVAILAACVWGVTTRHISPGLETWAVVAVVAGACDVALVVTSPDRWTVGWYGARGLGLAGAVLVLIAMLREVSALHRGLIGYARRLESQNTALRSAQGLRDHLIAVVSHDLRTPIAGLQGYLELLRDDEGISPELAHRMHDRSWLLTRRLALLTEDLLSVATVDHGDLQMIPEQVDLTRQLADCATGFPGRDLLLDCPPGLTAIADPLRLQQVLANLVHNALKHGAEPVRIIAQPGAPATPGAPSTTVTISVADAGPGVPAAFVPRLFERYSRADDRSTAGSGLGLSVVRDLAEAHGGSVDYVPGDNAFVVRLPAGVVPLLPRVPVGEPDVTITRKLASPWRGTLARLR